MQANAETIAARPPVSRMAGYLHLAVIYVVWGTTYLAIRVAVREGAGFPPFGLGAMRLIAAGLILLAACRVSGQSLRVGRRELIATAVSGILLWNGGNGLVLLGERVADSGYTALLLSTAPVWSAVIETLLDRRLPGLLLSASLITGFAGLSVLSLPTFGDSPSATPPWAVLVLTLAPFIWALGSVFQKRSRLGINPVVASAYQQLAGGIVFTAASVLAGEPFPTPNAEAWMAWGYLVLFGSLLAFTSYTLALRLLPMPVLMTYAYVNPVVAVFLGWLVLGEPVGLHTLLGTLLVLASVAGTFKAKSRG